MAASPSAPSPATVRAERTAAKKREAAEKARRLAVDRERRADRAEIDLLSRQERDLRRERNALPWWGPKWAESDRRLRAVTSRKRVLSRKKYD